MREPEFQDGAATRDLDVYRSNEVIKPRKRELNIWQRMSRIMEIVIYVLLILVFVRLFAPELEKQKDLQTELEKLQATKLEKETKVDRLRREHSNLINDRKYLDAVARDRLNLQREGEYVIQIER